MDAAAAAAMSDPERNRHFRRRWDAGVPDFTRASTRAPTNTIGTLGLLLQEALAGASRSTAVAHLRKPEGPTDG